MFKTRQTLSDSRFDQTSGITLSLFGNNNITKILGNPNLQIKTNNLLLSQDGDTLDAGAYDASFKIGGGFDGSVLSSQLYENDSKILLFGTFTIYENNKNLGRFISTNSDGSIVYPLSGGSGFLGTISHTLLDGDKVIVGGSISSFNGSTIGRIIRLNLDGSRDMSFINGVGFNNTVNKFVKQSDGKYICSGSFTSYSGISIHKVARLYPNGTLDTTFNVGVGFGTGTPTDIILQNDGKVILGGTFTTLNSVSTNRIVRLNSDGTRDESFTIGTGFNSTTSDIQVDSNGNILVSGNFTTYSGITANRMVRLLPNGALDTTFNVGSGPNTGPTSILIQSDQKIVACGSFTLFSGITVQRVIRLNPDGSIDNTFNVDFDSSLGTIVQINQKLNGNYIAIGTFDATKGDAKYKNVVELSANGSVVTDSFKINNTGFPSNGAVYTIKNINDKILVGGSFTEYNDTASTGNIIRLLYDGTLDTTFNNGAATNIVYDINVLDDGSMLIAGGFTTYSGLSTKKYLVKVDSNGNLDESFIVPGSGFLGSAIHKTLIDNNGKFLVGGNFTSYSGQTHHGILRLNSDGTIDNTFIAQDFITMNEGGVSGFDSFSGVIEEIYQLSNGNIVCVGDFYAYSEVPSFYASGIIYLTSGGTIIKDYGIFNYFDTTTNITSLIQEDEKIIVGGNFTDYAELAMNSGYTINGIIRLNTDATIDTSFSTGTGFNGAVTALSFSSDGLILVAGTFTDYNGTPCFGLVKLNLDGTLNDAFNFEEGFDSTPYVIETVSTSTLIGGAFNFFSGKQASKLVRLAAAGDGYTINSPSGLKYNEDISGKFTDFSLINKKYLVDYVGERINTFTNGLTQSGVTVSLGGMLTKNTNLQLQTYDLTVTGTSSNFNFTGKTGSILLKNKIVDLIGSSSVGVGKNRLKITDTGTTFYDSTTGLSKGILYGGNYISGLAENSLVPKNFVTNLFTTSNGLTFTTGNTVNLGGIINQNTTLSGVSYNLGIHYKKLTLSSNLESILTHEARYGVLDESSKMNEGFDYPPTILLNTDDGKFVAFGSFSRYDGQEYSGAIRLNADGTLDKTFNNGVSGKGQYDGAIILPDGKLFVIGSFFNNQGVPFTNYVKLNSDGTVDTTFNHPSHYSLYINSSVYDLTLQSDNKIIIGGGFTEFSGVTKNRILRFNIDGTIDNTFNIGTGFNQNAVHGVKLQSDGKIIVVGTFSAYNGVTANGIVRLNSDGTIDNTFNSGGTGFLGQARKVAIQDDDKIIVTGTFQSYNGNSHHRLIRLNPDGSIDSTFPNGTSNNNVFNGDNISSIVVVPGGKILFGGDFDVYSGVTKAGIVRINYDGSIDNTFDIGVGLTGKFNGTAVERVHSIHYNTGTTKITVCGSFSSLNDQIMRKFIVRFSNDGTLDDIFTVERIGLNNSVSVLEKYEDKIFVGGSFSHLNGKIVNGLFRTNRDGTIDNSFRNGLITGGSVDKVKTLSDGKIIILSSSDSYSGVSNIGQVFKIDKYGYIDPNFKRPTFTSSVSCVDEQLDGKILIGGNFTSYSGISANKLVRIYSDGGIDNTLNVGSGFNGEVRGITAQDDGKIIVVGAFSTFSGLTKNYIVRLNSNGSLDETFITGTGFGGGSTYVATIQTDGKILVGGDFSTYNGNSVKLLVRLNSDGTIDNTFNSGGTGFLFGSGISSIRLDSKNRIVVGGRFNTYNGVGYNDIIRLFEDGTLDLSFNSGTGTSNDDYSGGFGVGYILDIALADTSIYFGGSSIFQYNGDTAYNYVKLHNNSDFVIDNSLALRYNGDYSLHYSARSIPDVEYVTGLTSQLQNEVGLELITGSTFTASTTSHYIHVSATTLSSIWLPLSPKNKQQIYVSDAKGNASTNIITIHGNGKVINGVSTALIDTNYGSLMFVYNGFNWIGGSMLG